jgi:N-acetylglutamate synthase-like GNAT family acetyltransferase
MSPDLSGAVRIRPVTPADVPGILALVGEVYEEYGCILRAELEERHLLAPQVYFRSAGGEFWVAERNVGPHAPPLCVGTAGVYLHERAGELKSLYVQRRARGHGLGTRLVRMAIDHARQAGRSGFFLWSDTRFRDAHRLYERMGFWRGCTRDLHDSNNSVEYEFTLPGPEASEFGGS